MKKTYNVEIETRNFDKRTEERMAIDEFIESANRNVCFEYDTEEEAKKGANLTSQAVKAINKKLGKDLLSYAKRKTKVYVKKNDITETETSTVETEA